VLRRFLQNTAISAVAYGLAGVLGLLAVGVITRAYGLAVLGLIVLVRSFLPTGLLTLIDFGVSEITTQTVARGRVGDWSVAGEKLSLLIVIAGLTGLASSIVLWAAAPTLARIFRVAPDQADAFVSILKITAATLPIGFLGLVTEGALKGVEHYGWLRVTEVGSNMLYVAAVYLSAWYGAPFQWLAYSYLAAIVGKYLILSAASYFALCETPLHLHRWGVESRRDVFHRCWLMFNSRIGGGLQQTIIPIVIGALYSPVEIGAYDLIMRLPRFLKTTMAPLYSAILPISTHIDETTDTRRMQILGRNGFVLPSAIIIPVLVVFALFSKEILDVWVGPQRDGDWPWLAVALLSPAVSVMLGAGTAALMARADFMRVGNRLLYLQVLMQFLLTAIFLVWFQEMAFILGWVISVVAFAPVFAHYILSYMKLPRSLFWGQLARQIAVAAILAAVIGACKMFLRVDSLASLIVFGGLSCILAWALSAAIILSHRDREMLGKFATVLAPR
jgi:O-antigen/teichoic acid export membrane protein